MSRDPAITASSATAHIAQVLSVTRRSAQVLVAHSVYQAAFSGAFKDLTVGDRVRIKKNADRWQVTECQPRSNFLTRSYRERTKYIAANLDLLIIVSSVMPPPNTIFIDRMLAVAELRSIAVLLLFNKGDLPNEHLSEIQGIYQRLGFPLLLTSVKDGQGMSELSARLADPEYHTVALAGISGVGKSSILNHLVPSACRRTAAVSSRTGQGTQTTSLARGYRWQRAASADLILIDLPGMQNFGVSDLSERECADAFREFYACQTGCEYADCQHLAELNCAVKAALNRGELAPSRYASYCNIIEEIRRSRRY